ncbi:diguanylate cyclase [Ideonella sp.]|uniref:sensor domain-containing diguanylate cyclase n=1 Tax=Ideonella sp. TaxID=1929293 RepID=UPI0035AE57E7
MFRAFRLQLTLAFACLALAVAAAVTIPLARMLAQQQLAARADALDAIAGAVALSLADGLHERLREVRLLASSPEAVRVGTDAQVWRAEIERLRAGRPYYAWIGVVDTHGRVTAASQDLLVGADVSMRPWFQQGLRAPTLGDVHAAKLLSSLLPPPAGGDPLRFVDLAAPLPTADGQVAGVLGVHVDWHWVRDVISRLRSQDARDAGVLVYILDRQGDVIHQPPGADAVAARPPPREGLAAKAQLLPWSDGVPYLSVASTLPARPGTPDLGWTVVVRQPQAQALAGAEQARLTAWACGAAVLAAAMTLAWLGAAWVSRPLVRMADAARRIDAGERGVRLPLSRQNAELEQLSTALRRMTEHLVDREQALQGANAHLEQRVAERTQELARVNGELAAANRHLSTLAHEDALTGLHNRRWADELLERLLSQHRRHRRPMGVLLCDVDHFKRINDRFGHATGDVVLQAVAQVLRRSVRDSDSAARFGGEEFVVLLPETGPQGARVVAEKIRHAVAALRLPGVTSCTISVGAAVAEDGRIGAAALLARADAALYRAKEAGRNRVELDEGHQAADPFTPGWTGTTVPAALDA